MRALVDKYNSLGEAQKKRGLIASLIVLGLIGIWLSSQEVTESPGPLIPTEIITPVSSDIYVHVVKTTMVILPIQPYHWPGKVVLRFLGPTNWGTSPWARSRASLSLQR